MIFSILCFVENNYYYLINYTDYARFMIEFFKAHGFNKKIYTPKYIKNGIRVMRKYLLPSLEFQSCKDFIWMLKIGNKANINYLKALLHFKRSFKIVIIYDKDHRNYIRNITKNADVLITTRIDYDDRIYYDAVNDVRKAVNKSKPMFLYGYTRGFIYYEDFDLYFAYFNKFKNKGASSIFESLIIFMNKVNDSYTINDLGEHFFVKKNLLQHYKKFGLEKLNYKPAIFEIDNPKFVWVRQKYSGTILQTNILKQKSKPVYFDLAKFYGLKN